MQRLGQAVRIEHHLCAVFIARTWINQLVKPRQRNNGGVVGKIAFHHRRQPLDISNQDQAVLAVVEREQQIYRRVGKIGAADVHKPVHRISAADHHRIAPRLGQTVIKVSELVCHALAGDTVRHPERA